MPMDVRSSLPSVDAAINRKRSMDLDRDRVRDLARWTGVVRHADAVTSGGHVREADRLSIVPVHAGRSPPRSRFVTGVEGVRVARVTRAHPSIQVRAEAPGPRCIARRRRQRPVSVRAGDTVSSRPSHSMAMAGRPISRATSVNAA